MGLPEPIQREDFTWWHLGPLGCVTIAVRADGAVRINGRDGSDVKWGRDSAVAIAIAELTRMIRQTQAMLPPDHPRRVLCVRCGHHDRCIDDEGVCAGCRQFDGLDDARGRLAERYGVKGGSCEPKPRVEPHGQSGAIASGTA